MINSGGFGRAPRWLLNDSAVSAGAKALFALLDDRGNVKKKNESWWSEPELGQVLGVTDRTIRRWVRELEQVVAVSSRQRPGTNLWRTHLNPDISVRVRERQTWTPVSRLKDSTRTSASANSDISVRSARTSASDKAETAKQKQEAAAPTEKLLKLARQDVNRRIRAGQTIRYPEALARKIASEDADRLLAGEKTKAADDYRTAGVAVAPDPSVCQHNAPADLGDIIKCAACGTEWPKSAAQPPRQ